MQSTTSRTSPASKRISRPHASELTQSPPAAPSRENLEYLDHLDLLFHTFVRRAELSRSENTIHWFLNTYSNYRKYVNEHLTLSPTVFRESLVALDRWADWNLARGVSATTTNTYWRGLRSFFKYWSEQEGIDNPYASQRAPAKPSAVPKALTETECRRILDAASHHPNWSAFDRARALACMAVMLYAGLRRSEVIRLQYRDVNLEENVIHVLRGKGVGGGKDRVVVICEDLKRILIRYLRERDARGFKNPEFFSSTRLRGGGVTGPTLKVIVGKLRVASGVRFTLHQLRHSFVTHLLRAGAPLHVVRDLAGHANIATTMIYTRVFDSDRRASIERIHFV